MSEAKYEVITLGETICRKLKQIYFTDMEWPKCFKEISQLFTKLKHKARVYYPVKTDEEMLKGLRTWSDDEIKEALTQGRDDDKKIHAVHSSAVR